MTTLEITLLVAGVIIFAVSFLLPDRKSSEGEKETNSDEIRRMMEAELNGMKLRVNEATDETVEYAMERAERQLERVSNEKIMALSEYSDTIMEGIDHSHKEVLFMYDMLNDKQTELTNTVRKAEATTKEVVATVKETEQKLPQEEVPEMQSPDVFEALYAQFGAEKTISPATPAVVPIEETAEETVATETESKNNNERILALSKGGMGTVEIARELGLGVGEVKLVLDLFKD